MTKRPPNSTLSHVLKHHLILPLHPFFHSDSIALTAILDADGILATPDITDRFGFAISDPIKFSDPKNNNNQGGDIKKKQRVVPLRNEAKISINLKSDGTTVLHIFCTLCYSRTLIEYSHTRSLTHFMYLSCFHHTHLSGKEYTTDDVEVLQRLDNFFSGVMTAETQ